MSIDHSSPQALYDSLVGVSGNSGNDLVVSGDADASWLWVRMSELNGESSMPPTGALDETVRNLGAPIGSTAVHSTNACKISPL